MKRIFLACILSLSVFAGSQVVYNNTAFAAVQCGKVIVYETTIKDVGDYIQVKVRYNTAPHPMFWAFKQINGKWMYGDAVAIDVGQSGWSPVASSKLANDVLYVVLQYI